MLRLLRVVSKREAKERKKRKRYAYELKSYFLLKKGCFRFKSRAVILIRDLVQFCRNISKLRTNENEDIFG